jgi:hypothetical protein
MDFLLNCAPIIEAWKNSFLFSLNWLPIFLFYLAIPVQRFRNYQTTRLRPRWIVRLYRRFGYTETASFSMQCRLWGSQCNSGKIAYSTPTKEKGKFYFGMSLTFIFFSPPPSFFLLSTINNHCAPQVHHCTHNPGILFSPVCSLTIFFFFFFFFFFFLTFEFHGRALCRSFPRPKNSQSSRENYENRAASYLEIRVSYAWIICYSLVAGASL